MECVIHVDKKSKIDKRIKTTKNQEMIANYTLFSIVLYCPMTLKQGYIRKQSNNISSFKKILPKNIKQHENIEMVDENVYSLENDSYDEKCKNFCWKQIK